MNRSTSRNSSIKTKLISHKTETALHHEIEITMTEVLLLNITLVHDMIVINETLDRIVLRIDHTDHLTDAILVLDTYHVLIQEITLLPDVFHHSDLRQNQEILQIPSPALTLTQETKLIVYKLNQKKIHMYHPTEMANA